MAELKENDMGAISGGTAEAVAPTPKQLNEPACEKFAVGFPDVVAKMQKALPTVSMNCGLCAHLKSGSEPGLFVCVLGTP